MKGKVFTAQEVQAIIAGNKTMFRKVIKKTQIEPSSSLDRCGMELLLSECPYQIGQKIFCKETWGRKATESGIAFKADNPNQLIYQHSPVKWRLPQHMKQEHSRITLEITDVKVERLKDISEENAVNEGVWNIQEKGSHRSWDIKNAFATFWNATHKKPEEKFEANPFVWVVDFKINN